MHHDVHHPEGRSGHMFLAVSVSTSCNPAMLINVLVFSFSLSSYVGGFVGNGSTWTAKSQTISQWQRHQQPCYRQRNRRNCPCSYSPWAGRFPPVLLLPLPLLSYGWVCPCTGVFTLALIFLGLGASCWNDMFPSRSLACRFMDAQLHHIYMCFSQATL